MKLIPLPRQVRKTEGHYTLAPQMALNLPDGAAWRAMDYAFVLSAAHVALGEAAPARIHIVDSREHPEEGYTLTVTKEGVSIAAGGGRGALYALVSLVQLTGFGQTRQVPCCEIHDAPAYAYRGVMVDTARHFIPVGELRRTLDRMCLYKLNALHLHLTDDQGWRLEVRAYPRLCACSAGRAATQINTDGKTDGTPYGEGLYYTQGELRELVAYAAARGIDVIPEVDVPGHMLGAIHAYPELSCRGEAVEVRTAWGVEDVIGCPASPAYQEFLSTVLGELLDVFPSEKIHIGGDEVPYNAWRACPRCQELMQTQGLSSPEALQQFVMASVSRQLAAKGRQAVVWDERLPGKTAPNTVLQLWRQELDRAASYDWLGQGGKVIVSYGPYFYFDYSYATTPLSKTYGFRPADISLDEKQGEGILGLECTVWTEWIRDRKKYEFQLYPRMQAFAECAWTPEERRDFHDFRRRMKPHLRLLRAENVTYCPLWYAQASAGRRALRTLGHQWFGRHDGYEEVRSAARLQGVKKHGRE